VGRLTIPNSATLHAMRSLFAGFDGFEGPEAAALEFHPGWTHMEPIALAATAAWGAHWRQRGVPVVTRNLDSHLRYAARMRLFDHVGVDFHPQQVEHEEAGRFLPITQVHDTAGVRGVIADISALLHLDEQPDTLAAVQYCVSELLRNVLEHSGSGEGAFVCAQRFPGGQVPRVSIAVADCGIGVAAHLGRAHTEAQGKDAVALALALQPGTTGAVPGLYGTAENAGAGLFLTRSIAKGTGGYFAIVSGNAAYRQYRTKAPDKQAELFVDPLLERHNFWQVPYWRGTVVALEVRTDWIADFEGFFSWIRQKMPRRHGVRPRARFS
jgi:anti-sigma regulatory factor (Ser/Thr protein kinase)